MTNALRIKTETREQSTRKKKREEHKTVFQPMLKQVPDNELEKVRALIVAKGLLRKVATQNGVRYEITNAGWQFVKKYEDSSGSFVQQAELVELQYETMKPEISIVIPTLDEAKTIGAVLNAIQLQYPWEVLVLDASNDETALVAAKSGARVVRQNGHGKGGALRQAFHGLDSDIIVMLDGDASMRPQEIPSLVQAILDGADMAKGSRFLRGGYSEDLSFIRKIGNLIFVSLVNMFWSGTYTDLCYGLMAFRRSSLERLKPYLKSQHFQIETELCIRAKKLGMKVVEVPSIELRRMHGKSKLVGIRDSFRILQTIVREMLSPV